MPARRQSARKGSSPATASASAASVDLMSTLRLLPSLSLARSARWAPPRATAYMDAELAWRSTTDAFSAAATASMGSRFADLHESLAAAPCQLWVVRSVGPVGRVDESGAPVEEFWVEGVSELDDDWLGYGGEADE